MPQSFLISPGTSAEDQARQRMAYEMLQQGMQGGPVQHWAQGAGRVAKALVGGYHMRNMRDEGKKERSEANKILGDVLGLGGSPAPQTSSTPPWRAPSTARPEVEAGTGSAARPGGSVVDSIIQAESAGNPTAKNPRSSAYGSGQFIDATWLDMVRRHKPELAQGRNNDEILSLRADPALSREMTALYAQDNGQILQRYGFEATPGNVYLAHFAGPGGAVRLLSADPSAPVANVLGRPAIEANPFLADMTVGDVQAWAGRKGGGGATPSAPAPAPATQPQPANLDAPRSVQTQTIDPYTGNAMQGGGQPSPQQGGMPQPPQAQPQAAPQSRSTLGIDQQTAQVIQKLSGNRYTAPLAMKLLESAMTPKSGKDRYISTGQGVFDTQTQAYVPGTEKKPDPTTTQRDFETAKSQGYQGSFFDYQRDLKQAGASNVNIGHEKEYDKTRGKSLGEEFGTLQTNAQQATNRIGQLRQIDSLLSNPNVYTGTGAQAINALKRTAQTLLGQENIEGVADADVARRISLEMALSLREDLLGPGVMSDPDRRMLESVPPNIGDSAEGRKLLVELMTAKEQRKIEIGQLAREYAERNNGRLDDGWHAALARYSAQNPVFSQELMDKARTMSESGQQQSPAAGVVPRIQSDEDFDALPPGAQFIGPDGKLRRKP